MGNAPAQGNFISRTSSKLNAVLTLTAAVAVASGFASVSQAAPRTPVKVKSVPGELIVKVKSGSGVRAQATVNSVLQQALAGTQILSINSFQTDGKIQKVKLADASKVSKAIQALKKNPSIAFAEPNYLYHRMDEQPSAEEIVDQMEASFDNGRRRAALPNDPEMNRLWGLVNTGQADAAGQTGTAGSDVNVAPLWDLGITGSKNIVVAVIDTGIQWDHPDLVDNLYTNPGEAGDLANNGIDDDGNGFVDDAHGWNFHAKTRNSADDHKHGTHCAGTIGAKGNNGLGVAGVNWDVTLMPIKFLNASGGGSLEGAVESINYATMMKVNVMSNSWGGGGYSEIMKEAISRAERAGILFVAAAGNDSSNNDSAPTYPASYAVPNVVSVAAIDNRDKLASFSNYGASTGHVAAPGVKVYSTTKDGQYEALSGTSMACPHVAGVSALLLSANPDMGYAEVKSRLIKTSVPVSGLRRKVLGAGRVNAFNALNNIVPPSNEPDPSLWTDHAMVVESDHPYADRTDKTYPVSVPGAKYIRVVFDEVNTEKGYDVVSVENTSGTKIDELSGRVNDYTTDYYQGDSVVIRLKSDVSNTGYGFRVSKVQVIK